MIITDVQALRVECQDVLPEEVADLKAQLEEELAKSPILGIGLAAPQIGIAKKMAIIRIPNSSPLDLVNATISQKYDQFVFNEEGCLSFPNKTVRTLRYKEIYVTNNLVYPHSFIATGLVAVCIQHELDHLRGVLLPDLDLDKHQKNKKFKPKVKLTELNQSNNYFSKLLKG